jgi:hypothetical protein
MTFLAKNVDAAITPKLSLRRRHCSACLSCSYDDDGSGWPMLLTRLRGDGDCHLDRLLRFL